MNFKRPFECNGIAPLPLTRRDLLKSVSAGFGWLAFSALTSQGAEKSALAFP